MQWFAQAPANIALIKYMGKKDNELNIPDNPSLSYTLTNLLTNVMLEKSPGKKDIWEPLQIPGAPTFELSVKAQQRFLLHLERLKTHFNCMDSFILRSTNNFPQGSGLASSASSFAALTLCAVRAMSELKSIPLPSITTQAQLSRLGSGSSCRSFFSPWALWQDEKVAPVELPYTQLLHQAILISHDEKKVPSSEAHQRVKTSPLYKTRTRRANEHLKILLDALRAKEWQAAYQICWNEFQDMHHLFSSCEQPFTYMTDETHRLLQKIKDWWAQHNDGPIVTMDAGPNIHLLYRPDQTAMAQQFKQDHLIGNYDVL